LDDKFRHKSVMVFSGQRAGIDRFQKRPALVSTK